MRTARTVSLLILVQSVPMVSSSTVQEFVKLTPTATVDPSCSELRVLQLVLKAPILRMASAGGSADLLCTSTQLMDFATPHVQLLSTHRLHA